MTDTAIDWFGEEASSADAARLAALYDLDADSDAPSAGVDWFRGLARMSGGPVLELGVGTGRVAVPIAKDGHEVVGIDRSEAMLARAEERARKRGVRLRLLESDMRTFSLEQAFMLVTIPFNTFLMLTPDDQWACLARVREHLAPGGRLAIDIFQPNPNMIAGRDNDVREEWTRRDPDNGRMVTKFSSTRADVDKSTFRWWYDELDDAGVVHRWQREATLHFIYRREAELLMSDAGYDIETLHGDYDGSPPSSASPKILIVARRRERGSGRERRR